MTRRSTDPEVSIARYIRCPVLAYKVEFWDKDACLIFRPQNGDESVNASCALNFLLNSDFFFNKIETICED